MKPAITLVASRDAAMSDAAAAIYVRLVPRRPVGCVDWARAYSYVDESTGRQFEVEHLTEPSGYRVLELVPTSLLYSEGCYRPNEVVREVLARLKPNSAISALRASGIDADCVKRVETPSRCLRSLHACVELIASSIAEDRSLALSDGLNGKIQIDTERAYWLRQHEMATAAKSRSSGIFHGCYDAWGQVLDQEARDSIMSYLNAPSLDRWRALRFTRIAGPSTLWHAWAMADNQVAQTMDDSAFPDKDVLIAGIRRAVIANQLEIEECLVELQAA